MKKIGLITFHKAISYGAGFQTYALQSCLEKLGFIVEVIDYVPERFAAKSSILVQPKRKSLLNRIIKYLPYVVSKGTNYCLVIRFNKLYLHLSKDKYKNMDDLTAKPMQYDFFVTGSDQVWNLSLDEFKNIEPYLLKFAPNTARKIAYAASIGIRDFDAYEELVNNDFKCLLQKYDWISVRENSAQRLLKEMGIDSDLVLDPTFLLDKYEWAKMAEEGPTLKYILVYGLYRNKQLYKLASRLARKYDCKVINMADSYDFMKGANNRIVTTHEKLLGYIKSAVCVITDSFHGTALSLNMNVPVYIFPALRNNTRLESVVELFHLEERYVRAEEMIDSIDVIAMDYESINKKMESERRKAFSFLEDALAELYD